MEYIVPEITSVCKIMSLEAGSRVISIFYMIVLFGSLIYQNVDFTLEYPKSFLALIQEFIVDSSFTNHRVDCRDIIIAALLIRGVYKKDLQLMLPWILFQCTYLLVYILSFIGYLFDLWSDNFAMNVGLFDAEIQFIMMVYRYCAILIVYNFYRELDVSAYSEIRLK